ncbi:MAG: hypothetical protein HQL64_04500 [Magnetococcales bacterium]|nr:hypothetical protein [Magnetococcales bacterium]
MSMSEVILKALTAYALLIIIGFAAAYMIKVVVSVLSKGQKGASVAAPSVVLPASVCSASGEPPRHHLVAIAAAVYTMNRRVRIVHLRSDVGVDVSWASVGRSLNQASHQVRR